MKPLLRDLLHFLQARLISRPLARLACRLHTEGFESLSAGPWLLACPYASAFDPALLSASSPRALDFLGMPERNRPGLSSWFFRRPAPPPITGDAIDTTTFHHALQRLREGRIVGIFFGTGSAEQQKEDGGASGVSSLAQISGIPVRACLILGSPRLESWRLFQKRPTVLVILGEPFSSFSDLPPKAARADLDRRLQETLQNLRQCAEKHPAFASLVSH